MSAILSPEQIQSMEPSQLKTIMKKVMVGTAVGGSYNNYNHKHASESEKSQWHMNHHEARVNKRDHG